MDFVVTRRGRAPTAIECKWSADEFDAANLRAFRNRYPQGNNYVVAHDVRRPFTKRFGGTVVRFVSLDGLIGGLR